MDQNWESEIFLKCLSELNSKEGCQLPIEFLDIFQVIDLGAKKYGAESYLDKDNFSIQHKNNTASMFRHLAEHHMGVDADKESGVDPLLHLACRAIMAYTRKKRKIDEQN